MSAVTQEQQQDNNIANILENLRTKNSLYYFTRDVLSQNLNTILEYYHSHEENILELLSSLLPNHRDKLINILYNRSFVGSEKIIELFKNHHQLLNDDDFTVEDIIKEVTKNIYVLVLIPDYKLSHTIISEAIKYDFEALLILPDYLITDEHFVFALNKDFISSGTHEDSLPKIENNRLTDKIIYHALEQNGKSLDLVPVEIIKFEHCEQAVKQNGKALKYVPHNLKTPSLLDLAIVNNPKLKRKELEFMYDYKPNRTYD
jgi:hypothetical protein